MTPDDLISDLQTIHSALDRGLGDTDISDKTSEELYDENPIQWAAQTLAGLILLLSLIKDQTQPVLARNANLRPIEPRPARPGYVWSFAPTTGQWTEVPTTSIVEVATYGQR